MRDVHCAEWHGVSGFYFTHIEYFSYQSYTVINIGEMDALRAKVSDRESYVNKFLSGTASAEK